MDRNSQEAFFSVFFKEMRESHLDYAVLHSWQELPYKATSDVDMVIAEHQMHNLLVLLCRVEAETSWRVVQRLWYDVPHCYYYVAVSPDTKVTVALDFLSDPRGLGEYRIKDGLLLEDCVETGIIRHLAPESELAYKLAKRRIKGVFKQKDLEFVKDYYPLCEPGKLKDRFHAFMPQTFADQMLEMLHEMPELDIWANVMGKRRFALRIPGVKWSFHANIRWWGYMVCRTLNRLRHASGAVVYLRGGAQERDWQLGFTFRKVLIMSRGKMTDSLKRKALLKTWLVIVCDSAENAIEVVPQRVEKVYNANELRNELFNALQKRYRRYYL